MSEANTATSTAFDQRASRFAATCRFDDGGLPLPVALRQKFEDFFGADLLNVRIHPASPLAQAIGAHALAVGSHVHYAPDYFDLDSTDGLRRLGHELTHVLQQRCGRVAAPQGAAAAIVYDRCLEVEADIAGDASAHYVTSGGGGAKLAVDTSGRFSLDDVPSLTVNDFVHFRNLLVGNATPTSTMQCVVTMPHWWVPATALTVEAFIAARAAPVPNQFMLYHGSDQGFHDLVTGFNGSEQAWVNNFFQFQVGGNAHAGPGIYGASGLAATDAYGATKMKVISSTFARTRYVDCSGAGAFANSGIAAQDAYRYGYRCILRYNPTYYVVKDHRVEWEPL